MLETIERKTAANFTTSQVTRLQEAAETICDNALLAARSGLLARRQDEDLGKLMQDFAFLNSLKYGLAEGVTNVLVANDGNIQAIYLFEEATNPDSETEEALVPDMTIHLLLLVNSNSAALDAFVESLDRALTEVVRDLPSPLLDKRTSILNVIPITQEEVDAKKGYGVLLSSIFARPVKLWARKA